MEPGSRSPTAATRRKAGHTLRRVWPSSPEPWCYPFPFWQRLRNRSAPRGSCSLSSPGTGNTAVLDGSRLLRAPRGLRFAQQPLNLCTQDPPTYSYGLFQKPPRSGGGRPALRGRCGPRLQSQPGHPSGRRGTSSGRSPQSAFLGVPEPHHGMESPSPWSSGPRCAAWILFSLYTLRCGVLLGCVSASDSGS